MPAVDLTIDNGSLNLWSADQQVHLHIVPRRSPLGDPTLIQLRCAPAPRVELHPEQAPSAPPMEAWVWNGSPADAQRICDQALASVAAWLHRPNSSSARSVAWRQHVRNGLGLAASDAPAGTRDRVVASG